MTVVNVLLYSLIPFAALGVGGVVAVVWPPGRRATARIQHFAAGVIFCAVAVELLPPVHSQSPLETIVGFGLGIAAVLGIRSATGKIEKANGKGSAGLLITTGVDVLIDGLVIGAAFASGEKRGVLMIAAISLEFFFLGISSAGSVRKQSKSAVRVLLIIGVLGVLVIGGTVGGAIVLSGVSAGIMAMVLSFGSVAMMYLVTEELLVEAHEVEEGRWETTAFFMGFLVYLLISEALGSHE